MNDQNKEDFVKVAETKDVQTSQMKEVQIDGQMYVLQMWRENTMQLVMCAHMKVVL
jgi:hypothetical protein